MLKMSSQIENIVNAYKTLSKIPTIVGGKLSKCGTKVSAKWSVRNLDKGKHTKFLHNYVLDNQLNVISESEHPIDVSNELLSAVSPQETFRAVIREEKDSKDAKKQYLEVWSKANLEHCIDLTALDLHGDVYADSEFGSLDWSPDESSIVYIAERKLKKSEPYIKRKGEEKKPDGSGEAPPKKGEEFIYKQDWGEQLVGKHLSVIVVCRVASETFTVLDSDILPETCCPGQVRFSPDGTSVAGVAWPTEPRRLGLIFCTNRPGFIFEIALDGSSKRVVSTEGSAVRSCRYSAAGALLWLQRPADGPHHAAHAIMCRHANGEVSTVVDIVQSETTTANNEKFYGVYSQALPTRCFSQDGRRLVFSSPQRNEVRSYVAHIDSGKLVDISNRSFSGSTTVLDVSSDVILAVCSNMITPTQLFVACLPAEGQEAEIKWTRVSQPVPLPPAVANSTVQYLDLEHKDSLDSVKSFSAIYFAPSGEDKKLPLIVWPHGGPHSGFVNAYSIEAALFNMLGIASGRVNYRGSIGFGDANARCLNGHVGDYDVNDCLLALNTLLKRDRRLTKEKDVQQNTPMKGDEMSNKELGRTDRDGKRNIRILEEDGYSLFLYGGSFGGFTVAHLAAKYPDWFRAMAMRNPLIDLATKGHYADNSDGCAVEAGFEFTEKGPVSEEQLVAMRRCSPLAHVHKVKAPTALMLGTADKRVPHYQGLDYARRLKANGVTTRIYMYDDNHSLSSLPVEMDNLINGASWFLEHLPA